MRKIASILLLFIILLVECDVASAQRWRPLRGVRTVRWQVDSRGDSLMCVELQEVRVFNRKRDLKNYQRMVRAVKKVYPLAQEAARRMKNLDEQLAQFDNKKDRKEYTEAIEEALKEELTPMLWKMTRYEGKILLKLIDRETNHTAFNIIKDIRSGFTATFYQMLAQMFGNNLKLEYDPLGEDEMLEYIVKQYRAGVL
jgi:protein subunit release factor A